MAYIIPALAAILFLISFALFLLTGFTKKQLYFFFDPQHVNVVFVVRMLSGFIVLAVAPASGAPELMLFLGAGIIFVAFTTPFLSDERLEQLGDWWLSLSNWALKFWALGWMLIWFFFGYIALPKESYLATYISSYISAFMPSFY
ncbi:MAG: hypothetical protein QNL62_18615 [Gammaproteobacteria bacterium]|nr:hypothetical protein [Gammaproteobacteria bacterium]